MTYPPDQFEDEVRDVLDDVVSMLLEKNQSYGDSALNPLRIFSKSKTDEQLCVRIDDKLSRIARGNIFSGDNDLRDLIGYLVLLMIQTKRNGE